MRATLLRLARAQHVRDSRAVCQFQFTPKAGLRSFSSSPAAASGLRELLSVSEEVADAVATNKPVVALESTIYTHGILGNDLAKQHLDLVRRHGGIPAIIAIVDGRPKVGVSYEEILRMIEDKSTVKASRRDIAYLVGMGLAGRKIHGGTTIAGTMLLAKAAGIRVFGTGGLGGVHRGGESSMDVSADLTELGRTRVAVIGSGCKGFLDIPRTLEFLETQGCLVSSFADGRQGSVDFPAFWARESGIKSPLTVTTEKEAASIIYAQEMLGIESGMFFANPISEEHGIPAAEMQVVIEQAVREANEKGFTGSNNTPYILGRLRELTSEKTVVANKALVHSNIIRATKVSVELSRLLSPKSSQTGSSALLHQPVLVRPQPTEAKTEPAPASAPVSNIMVAGSVAVDLSCDYSRPKSGDASPQSHVSNPSRISQSVGGVGRNVAVAAHLASGGSGVQFCSLVGDDVAGQTVLTSLNASGLNTSSIMKLNHQKYPEGRTAQYVAVNDGNKDLVLAMADMNIFSKNSFSDHWRSTVAASKPKWLVVDGNWAPPEIRNWIRAGEDNDAKVAFEPVSAEKSKSLFCPERGLPRLNLYPEPSISLASPNTYELAAMYNTAKDNGYFEPMDWFEVIDAFGMRGARDRFIHLTSVELTDAGVPIQTINLLPYIPTILTKLGSKGVLMTAILGKDDPRLRDRDEEEFILTRSPPTHPVVGGVYMRLFPAVESVKDIVSVNGVGDTFLGVLISGLAQGGRVDKLVDVAQRGAVLTLKSTESLSLAKASDVDWTVYFMTHIYFNKAVMDHQKIIRPKASSNALKQLFPRRAKFEINGAAQHEMSSDVESTSGRAEEGKQKLANPVYEKDSDEEELERLVLGDRAGFRENLFENDSKDLFGGPGDDMDGDGDLEEVDDDALFMVDTAMPGVKGPVTSAPKGADDPNAPVWEDSDDERLAISLANTSRLRKLRLTEAEDLVSGTEYCRRLRQQYLRLNPSPAWAREAEGRPSKRRRSSAASSDSSDSDSDAFSAEPLEKFLRSATSLGGVGSTKTRRLRPEVLDIQRTREIPDKHKAAVSSLSFHPQYPVLLSASSASILYLHHIAADAQPTPHPRLTSVQARQVDVRRAAFLYPDGDKIVFGGRRRYFHTWDLPSGVVAKTTQVLGHRLEHKTMEHFRLSPCGRYMAVAGSGRKGGGVVNVLSVASTQWIAAARLSSRHGVADFAWWSNGDGLAILGKDGQVGEYSVESQSFVGVWHDEGCVGGIVIALGGHQGPAALGEDRWVAVGSSSGITNIYERSELLRTATDGDDGEQMLKERPSPRRTFEQLVTAITALAFSPDGQLFAFGSQYKKDALRLVHLPTCTVYRNWPTEQTSIGRLTAVAFGRGSDLLAVGNDVGKIRLWDIRS
ncbi:IdgA domain protein [Cordyceps militaris CM01]|uniref:IdgA domain protein n=1 Tax=Cordyceps militaris (strain CM01) TaxID=983644 RepID=G3JJV3_CORMM|nr:IdgA domain protein [Cordyceps militaris CM01]EGX92137.1 IdgA domain protein [Cordyceps militaris CM01]